MNRSISTRDFIQIRAAADLLGVTEQTLRNWDKARKLKPVRHPINGYRMYRVTDLHSILRELGNSEAQATFEFEAPPENPNYSEDRKLRQDDLPPCHWDLAVALDPKHRPQQWNAPSTTVRRDWRKFPQEAHVLDATGSKYRRFTSAEVALLQGFDPGVIDIEGLTERERIGAVGDAVPPPLGRALIEGISLQWPWRCRTAIEICAGAGGLAEGAAAAGLEHLLLVDRSEACERVLKHNRPWPPSAVELSDIRAFDFKQFRRRVGLLSGGPPCQPWSQSGLRLGAEDQRDLLGSLPSLVAAIEPEVFLFENVPGLASEQNHPYLKDVVKGLQSPEGKLKYSVLVALFNAADYGVPQVRERLFIVGMKDVPAVRVSKCFDTIESLQTHQEPGGTRPKLERWSTVGSALDGREDPGGWRRWIVRE